MAHLLMYSTNYTVCATALHSHAHTPTRMHARHCRMGRARNLGDACSKSDSTHESPGGFQALAQALTTSMVGRRLFECSELTLGTVTWMADACNEIVQLS